jgi:hypothetical protein
MATLVRFTYEQLADPGADLSSQVEAAFGPEGLGICVVDNVPGYVDARATLLPLASQLASLPAEQLAALEDPESKYNFGWSHGKEKLEAGRVGASRPFRRMTAGGHMRRVSMGLPAKRARGGAVGEEVSQQQSTVF